MNVYTCLYHGNLGYGCRTRGRKWMFVPELGQPDNNIYKNLCLGHLIFKNPFDQKYEIAREKELNQFNLIKILKSLFHPSYKAQTVGGLLFTTF